MYPIRGSFHFLVIRLRPKWKITGIAAIGVANQENCE